MSAPQIVLANAALLLVYFVAGKLGLSFFGLIHPSASAVWLPTGIAMAALLLFGFRLVPAVFVGAFFVNVTTAGSISSSLGIALGNTLEAVLAAWLVNRFAGGRQAFATRCGHPRVRSSRGVREHDGERNDRRREPHARRLCGGRGLARNLVHLVARRRSQRRADHAVDCLVVDEPIVGSVAAQGAGSSAAVHRDRRDRVSHVLSSRAGPLSFAVSLLGAARLGRVAVRAAHARDGRRVACDRRDDGYGDRPRSVRDGDGERIAARVAGLPHDDGDDGAADGGAHRRASRVVRERTRRKSRCGCGIQRQGSVPCRVEPRAAESAGGYQHRGRRAATRASTASARVTRLVASIRRQSQHLARLIDDLLDIGRMTANKLRLRVQALELDRAVQSCVEALVAARGLAAGRIELALEPVWIEADPVRITQIVENLVGNALKHTPAGRRIRVTVRAVGATAELCVEDEGFGIRAELLPNVFEPFIQGRQGLDRSEGGLGIGLTLVRRLTELHGGSVEAHSGGVDRGSVFRRSLAASNVGGACAGSGRAAAAARRIAGGGC